jgi:hypothetical protein
MQQQKVTPVLAITLSLEYTLAKISTPSEKIRHVYENFLGGKTVHLKKPRQSANKQHFCTAFCRYFEFFGIIY